MANFFALRAIDITGMDLSGLNGAHDWGFDPDENATVHSKTYEDIIWFEEFDTLGGGSATAFGGTGFEVSLSGEVTAGTVTGLFAEQSQALAALAQRSMQLQATLQEGTLMLGDGARHVDIEPLRWK